MTFYRATLRTDDNSMSFNFIDYGEMMGFVGQALENGRFNNNNLEAVITIGQTEEVGLNE